MSEEKKNNPEEAEETKGSAANEEIKEEPKEEQKEAKSEKPGKKAEKEIESLKAQLAEAGEKY
ncbi:MAG: hypothetical protein IK047_03555, partial [Clostridia bacterium]|nr:hypothetical protein [Clostridia bacterium]